MANRGPSTSHPIIGLSIPSARPCSLFRPRNTPPVLLASERWEVVLNWGTWEPGEPNPEQKKGSSLGAPRPLDGAREPELSERNKSIQMCKTLRVTLCVTR